MSGLVTATNGGTTLASMTATQEELNLAAGLTAEGKRPEEVVEPKEEPKTEETEESPSGAPAKEAEISADSETEHEEEEQEQAEKPPVKGKGGFQKRIKELTRERDETRERLRALEAARQEQEKPPEQAQPKSDKPLRENFVTEDEWLDAAMDWREAKKSEEARQTEEKERFKSVLSNFNKQLDAEREAHDDFDEVISSPVEIPKSVELAIPHLKNGAAVAYHLGKNPTLAAQLMDMDPLEAVAEVGAISRELLAKSTAAPAPDKKPERRASAPIQPVPAGSSKASLRLDDPNLSQAEYNKIRDEQERARRKL